MTTDLEGPQDATPATRAHQRAVLDALPFTDTQDFEDAARGFVATLPEVEIRNAQGRVVWSLRDVGPRAGSGQGDHLVLDRPVARRGIVLGDGAGWGTAPSCAASIVRIASASRPARTWLYRWTKARLLQLPNR